MRELFAGKLSRVSTKGKVSTFRHLECPASVEVSGHTLFAGTMASTDDQVNSQGPGSVVAHRR